MNEVMQLPATLRLWFYYSLGVLNVGFVSAKGAGIGDGHPVAQYIDWGQQFTAGVSALFFGVAAANVVSNKMVAFRESKRLPGTVERPTE